MHWGRLRVGTPAVGSDPEQPDRDDGAEHGDAADRPSGHIRAIVRVGLPDHLVMPVLLQVRHASLLCSARFCLPWLMMGRLQGSADQRGCDPQAFWFFL